MKGDIDEGAVSLMSPESVARLRKMRLSKLFRPLSVTELVRLSAKSSKRQRG